MRSTFVVNLIFAIVILVQYAVIAVDKSKFKNCEQSTFCKRARDYKPGSNDYELLLETLQVNEAELKGTLYSHKSKTKLDLRLVSLVDSTFRLIVDEQSPIKRRYAVREALVSEPAREPVHVVRKTEELVEIAVRSSQNSAQLFRRPFAVKFLQNGSEVVTANGLNLMNFEHLRLKSEKPPTENKVNVENEEQQDVKPESESPDAYAASVDNGGDGTDQDGPGMWEESFSSFLDRKPYGPESVSLDFSFPKATHFYGVPEHADSLSLKSTADGDSSDPYRLYNLDVFEYELDSRMALYGAVPVAYALGRESCTGVYWQNAAETWVDVRKPSKGSWPISETISTLFSSHNSSKSEHNVHFISEAGIIDAFIMLGPTPKDAFEQYARLTGVAPLPPISTIAYHQCRWNYNDQEDVGNVSMNFDLYKLPMDYMWLDIEYTDQKKYFTWDGVLFPNPLKMIANLEKVGRKLVIIIDPHIKADANYFVNSDALAKSLYVLDENKNVYDGHCWPGNSRYLDFWRPQTNDYYSNLYLLENFKTTTQNVFIWNDMNEPSVFSGPEITMPKTNLHFDGQNYFEHREVHNLYGLKNVAATFYGLVKRSNFTRRPFILTRSHFAGSQRFAAVWTGDNAADWAHLRISIPMCLSLAISGISFCGADVGGFFGNPSDELLTRWYQSGAWLPFFRAHAHIETLRREPYLKPKDSVDVIRSALQQRYSYLPFWYLCFREHELYKTPVILPLFAEFPDDVTTFDIEDQFLIGGRILVKPITKENTYSTSVYFPGGQSEIWYDIYSGNTYSGIGYFDISAPINKVPVFQRGGSIVPKKERVRRSSSAMKHDPYTLVIALARNESAYGRIYADDGETYNYKKGEFIDQKLAFENNRLTATNLNAAAFYDSTEFVERIRIWNGPKNVLNAKVSVRNRDGSETSAIFDVSYANSDRELVVCCRQPVLKLGSDWTVELI